MARRDNEVIEELRLIYREEFGGKTRQRFLISWSDLRSLYGFGKLFDSRFERLAELGVERGVYLWDLGEGENGHNVAVVPIATVDRWRKVPRRIIREHLPLASDEEVAESVNDEDD